MKARVRFAGATLAAVAVIAAALLGVWRLASSAHVGLPRQAGASRPGPDDGRGFARVTVLWVVDGDTVHVRMPDGADESVRLIGVNAPEWTTRHEPYGAEATTYVKRLLPEGRTVWLEEDTGTRDKYGRLLAYVWLERPTDITPAEIRQKMLNARLLIDGYAQLMTIPPDVRHVDVFVPLQAEAREAGRGLWGAGAQ